MTQDIDIKALRKELGLTLRELADKMDVEVSTVHRWESQERRPHRVHLKKLQRLIAKQRGKG